MSHFDIQQTPIDGLYMIQRNPIGDHRGYLERMFCMDELESVIGDRGIMQINHTLTVKAGTVRGMHYQTPPYAEMKLVTCVRGEVFDVAVDLRRESPSFLCWHSEILSGDNHRTLAIPEGFAHGFQTLTDDCELLYLHTACYQPDAEVGLDALDVRLGIDWPSVITERSQRDQQHPKILLDYTGIVL